MDQDKIRALEKTIQSDYSNLAGILVRKNGETLYEHYFNHCTHASHIHLYSVTKSIISILIGIALDQGYIKSVDQKVLEFFPNYTLKRGEKTIQNITLEHLLTMTAPYKYKSAPYTKYFTSDSWVNASLDLLGGRRGKIGEFRYTPLIGPDILSGILVNVTGRSVLDFARKNLFTPLGILVESDIVFQSKEDQFTFIKAKENVSGWVADPTGVNTAGWGLTLTASDLAKLGQLYLNGGIWEGKQLISSQWITESTKTHSKWNELLYGYLWWIIDEGAHAYAALGDGGNVIYVNTEKNLVVGINSLFKSTAKDRIELIKEHIEPLFDGSMR